MHPLQDFVVFLWLCCVSNVHLCTVTDHRHTFNNGSKRGDDASEFDVAAGFEKKRKKKRGLFFYLFGKVFSDEILEKKSTMTRK